MLLLAYSLGLAIPFLVSSLLIERFFTAFQRFRPYLVWVSRAGGVLLILIGVLLVSDYFTLLASYLQGLTPDFLKNRL